MSTLKIYQLVSHSRCTQLSTPWAAIRAELHFPVHSVLQDSRRQGVVRIVGKTRVILPRMFSVVSGSKRRMDGSSITDTRVNDPFKYSMNTITKVDFVF